MALLRAAGLCRLAQRTPWTALRLLSSVAASGEPPGGEDKPGRLDNPEAQWQERALLPPTERVPPAQPHRPRNVAPTPEQKQLNADIQACASAEAVLGLVSSRLAVFNEVNAATALMIIARRTKSDGAIRLSSGDARFAQLLSTAKANFGLMASQQLSNTLYACGQLGITPPPDWLECFWDKSALKLGRFKPQELSNTLYACAQLGITPPVDWLKLYWHTNTMKLGDFVPQGFSNTLYACGQLNIMPPEKWLPRFWKLTASMLGEFIPQGLSNTMYACGQLGITPPTEWLQRYWHASALKLGEFKPQELSNTLYACGQLGITPPDDWMQHFWHTSASKLGKFALQGLSNTLYACGRLGIAPPADWMQRYCDAIEPKKGELDLQGLSKTVYAFARLDVKPPANWLQSVAESCERSLPDANSQHLSNTAFALASLGMWELPLWRGLWERLCLAMPRDAAGWNAEAHLHARQLYLAYQMAAVERPGLLPAPDPELLAAARKSWFDAVGDSSSRLHEQVSACLARMGVTHANEHWCERAERCIDIAIEDSGARVALEVDGPHHFLQDGRQDGSTLLRNRMLAAHGWRVVVVDYRLWQQPQTEAQREEYLRRLLA